MHNQSLADLHRVRLRLGLLRVLDVLVHGLELLRHEHLEQMCGRVCGRKSASLEWAAIRRTVEIVEDLALRFAEPLGQLGRAEPDKGARELLDGADEEEAAAVDEVDEVDVRVRRLGKVVEQADAHRQALQDPVRESGVALIDSAHIAASARRKSSKCVSSSAQRTSSRRCAWARGSPSRRRPRACRRRRQCDG